MSEANNLPMNNLRGPNIDSAAGKGLMTALQSLISFLIGLIVTVYQVPGVPDAIINFTYNHLPEVLVNIGIPLIIGSGATSFIINYLFRKNIAAY